MVLDIIDHDISKELGKKTREEPADLQDLFVEKFGTRPQ